MPKLQPNEKRIFLSFQRDEDLALYERLARDAEKKRYPLSTYVLLVLLEAYPAPEISTVSGKDVEIVQGMRE